MNRTSVVLFVTLCAAGSARAQFESSEVSGPGAEPFLLAAEGWTWEDLSAATPGVSYNVYRSVPGEGFRCIATNLSENAWAGDPESPGAAGVFWYQVSADDGWAENRLGRGLAVTEPCACSGATPSLSTDIALELVGDFAEPVHLTSPPGDRRRIHVAQRDGTIAVHDMREGSTGTFLDIRDRVRTCGEQGLLSLAFHPDFANNGRVFVYYNAEGGSFGEGVARIVEFSATDALSADPGSERLIYESERPTCFHVGGQIAFGPHDGLLYIGLGEGDYPDFAQDLGSDLGKMLRIDVDGAEPYEPPADNPYLGVAGALPELWAHGLRNPWRFGFDRETGDLYIGDVGDSCSEEISVGRAVDGGGEDFGWPLMEGLRCANGDCGSSCATCPAVGDCEALTMPVVDYDNVSFVTCAVIGGHVYRGCRLPEHVGRYFYSDWCDGTLRSFVLEGGVATDERSWDLGQGGPVSFGEDARGEIYLLTGDRVFRIGPG